MKIYIDGTNANSIHKVCEHSILSRNQEVSVEILEKHDILDNLVLKFLIPVKENFKGWAAYANSTILFLTDIGNLFDLVDDQYAVMKVTNSKENSLLLWNCNHSANQCLNFEFILKQSEEYLNDFEWLDPSLIGSIDFEWNWYPSMYDQKTNIQPKAINYIEGGPWDPYSDHVRYGSLWEREKHQYLKSIDTATSVSIFDHIPEDVSSLFKHILKYRVDPGQEHYNYGGYEELIKELKMLDNDNVYAVDGGWNPEEKKGLAYDPYMESFILGCGGRITNYDKVEDSMVPVIFRGITKMKHMKACEEKGRDYYYIDTGYFGNLRKKLYHRITKNAMQNIGPVIERPFDRLELTGWRRSKFRPGKNILLCPPSAKAMSCFGLDLDVWMEETIATIKSYTDRPIVIRKKLSRRERGTTDTMEMALSQDVHCLVTFNSIAATEALLFGKPAFTLGPNAAHALSLQDLSQIEKPYIPTAEELEAWAAHLAYCQFTESEMRDGTAWRILNDH